MIPSDAPSNPLARRRPAAAVLCLLVACLGVVGCEVDGWMFDPSVVGRWEHTPTVVPILERIDVIEADTGEFVDITEVLPEDLIPEVRQYRLGPGDVVQVEIMDLIVPGQPAYYERAIEPTGHLEIPQVGRLYVLGKTQEEVREIIELAVTERQLVREAPLVNLMVPGQRQATFSIFGAIQAPARYSIPFPDYRLLEAVTDAGGVSPVIEAVYVIRQVPLSDALDHGVQPPPTGMGTSPPGFTPPVRPAPRPPSGDSGLQDIDQLIEELTRPEEPAALGISALDPAPGEGRPPVRRSSHDRVAAADPMPAALQSEAEGEPPLIDLPESEDMTPPRATIVSTVGDEPPASIAEGDGASRWVFIDGRWVQVFSQAAPVTEGLPEGPDPLDDGLDADDLVTQRVIKVPVEPLLQGIARYNIVIRPGDVIHVPAPQSGVVYAVGPGIARPGTYNLPVGGRLTFQRLVAAAGGWSQIAIPERVDLTRIVGDHQQATIRLNARAIFEGTHPDIRLKPDDMLNFGTNFWATPMAVIRNGFRMTYGFGFLLDRNFGNDVFGAPPSNIGR